MGGSQTQTLISLYRLKSADPLPPIHCKREILQRRKNLLSFEQTESKDSTAHQKLSILGYKTKSLEPGFVF